MAELLPVAFHGDTLSLVEHNGEPFVAIKTICAAAGNSKAHPACSPAWNSPARNTKSTY